MLILSDYFVKSRESMLLFEYLTWLMFKGEKATYIALTLRRGLHVINGLAQGLQK